ncbi:hypothetical protein CPB86DRAFT_7693 [Serendipita vermifera]|nr:hypothetical protein CPB86DRAFT_7693 [Serendipita vermifera]
MNHHADSKLSLKTSFFNRSERGEETRTTPGKRRSSLKQSQSPSSLYSVVKPPSSTSPSNHQAPGVLPLFPIDSEEFPLLIENVPDMYKVPGQNVYFVPYGSSPMGTHPVWTSPSSSPTYQPFPESQYYPGQQPQYFEAMDSSSHRLYVVPGAGYEHDSDEEEVRLRAYASDGDRRSRKVSRGFYGAHEAGGPAAYYAESSRMKAENRVSMRPPPSVSPANSAATDESGRSSSYSSSGSSAGRSVRWHDDLVAPTPPPSRPRPKGWFNRRGDQLWCNDGRYKAAIDEYPPHLRDYPDVGEGWMNEHGVRISMTHRRVPDHPSRIKGVLKNNSSPLTFQ